MGISVLYLKVANEVRNYKRDYVDQKLRDKENPRSFKLSLNDVLDGSLEVQLAILHILIHHIGKFELTEFILELWQALFNQHFISYLNLELF